jgi:predicted nucleotidyltransferase
LLESEVSGSNPLRGIMKDFWKKPDLLIQTGSHLYGCATPNSDDDRRGFVIEPAEYLLGRKTFNQHEDKIQDVVIWGLQKFVHQLTKGTPNTFEIIFAPDAHILEITQAGMTILERREIFVAKNQLMPFAGFARSEWLKAQLKTKNKETGEVYFSPRVVGAKRKESHAKHGYSLKNAYHTVRLLSQGIELARDGFITFPRPEVDLLIDLRNGNLAFERVEAEVERLDAEMMKAIDDSPLPKYPNNKRIDELYYGLIEDRIEEFLEGRRSANTVS